MMRDRDRHTEENKYNNIRNENADITIDTQRLRREYEKNYEQ